MFFWWFSLPFQNKQGQEGQGNTPKTGRAQEVGCLPSGVSGQQCVRWAHCTSTRRIFSEWCFQTGQLSEDSRRLWLFVGCVRGFPRQTPGKPRESCCKNSPNREMLQILGSRAPEKANLLGTLGRHCPGPCSHLPGVVFFGNRQFQPSRVFLNVAHLFCFVFILQCVRA